MHFINTTINRILKLKSKTHKPKYIYLKLFLYTVLIQYLMCPNKIKINIPTYKELTILALDITIFVLLNYYIYLTIFVY